MVIKIEPNNTVDEQHGEKLYKTNSHEKLLHNSSIVYAEKVFNTVGKNFILKKTQLISINNPICLTSSIERYFVIIDKKTIEIFLLSDTTYNHDIPIVSQNNQMLNQSKHLFNRIYDANGESAIALRIGMIFIYNPTIRYYTQ